jgi:hypothetical protein
LRIVLKQNNPDIKANKRKGINLINKLLNNPRPNLINWWKRQRTTQKQLSLWDILPACEKARF